MKLIFVFLFVVYFSSAKGYIYQIDPEFPQPYPGKCYYEEKDLIMEPNEVHQLIGSCEKLECDEDLFITGTGCGLMAVKPPCFMTDGDVSLPYPECCPKPKCP